MAAFGITFPKLTLCRSVTSRNNLTNPSASNSTNTSTATPNTPTTGIRTLSLSIKNVPSQPLQYDVSTTTEKKKPTSVTTLLAIDGETKQLPKTLSVFDELRIDEQVQHDQITKQQSEENSNDLIHRSSSSLMGNIQRRSDHSSSSIPTNSKDETKKINLQPRASNQTFTPPTSSLSNQSSNNDLHLTLSSISVDIPQLHYPIEKSLDHEHDPHFHITEELPPDSLLTNSDDHHQAQIIDVISLPLEPSSSIQIEEKLIRERKVYDDQTNYSSFSVMSNHLKWYVSELRINRPLIYRTATSFGQKRRFSHSFSNLNQISNQQYRSSDRQQDKMPKEFHQTIYSTLSLEHWNQSASDRRHQSNECIFRSDHWSTTDNNENLILNVPNNDNHEEEDDDGDDDLYEDPCGSPVQRTLNCSLGRGDILIRNESVKKKLFDILNDDELENACLEDMSQEFEHMSIGHRHVPENISNIGASSDSLTPPTGLPITLPISASLLSSSSSSYHDNHLSSTMNHPTTDRYYNHSRLITTSLDAIPLNVNNNAYDHLSSSPNLRPSWFTSPSPQWRFDDQPSIDISTSDRSSSMNENLNSKRLFVSDVTDYAIKENKFRENCTHHCRNEQNCVDYSLLNPSTPLVDDTTMLFPRIPDKSSNLLMFI